MRRAGIAATLALALALAGCGEDILSEGDITGKTYQPAQTYTQIMMIPNYQTSCYGSGTQQYCTTTVYYTYIPYFIYDDADWIFSLRDCSVDPCREGVAYVTEATFNSFQVGDHYPIKDDEREDSNVETPA